MSDFFKALGAAAHQVNRSFANWFANSFVMFMTFVIIIAAIFLGMYFDGAYAKRWAPTPDDENQFMVYGWLVSLGMIFLMSAGIKAVQDGAKAAGAILIVAGSYFLILSITQSVGFVTLKAEDMTRAAEEFVAEEETDVDLVGELESQRDALNALIAAREGTLNGEIQNLDNDGKLNEELTEQMRSQRIILQGNQDAELARINKRILCLKGDETQCLAEEKAGDDESKLAPSRHDPSVKIWAYILTLGNADDDYRDGLTVYYLVFWSVGCPLLGLMLSCYLVITRHTREQAKADKDPIRVAAGKKGAKTKARRKRQTDKIEEQAESYLPRWKHALRLAKNTKYTAKGIAETAFKQGDMEHAITIMKRAGLITDEEIRLVKRMDENLPVPTNSVDVIRPDPSTTNGSGQPTEEGSSDVDEHGSAGAVSSN